MVACLRVIAVGLNRNCAEKGSLCKHQTIKSGCCYSLWPWRKWAGLPVRKFKGAGPHRALAAGGSSAFNGPMTRLSATTKGWRFFTWGGLFVVNRLCRLYLLPLHLCLCVAALMISVLCIWMCYLNVWEYVGFIYLPSESLHKRFSVSAINFVF